MGISSVLCMNGGDTETSYAMSSSLQAGVIKRSRSVVDKAIIELVDLAKDNQLMIADLGCAYGPNTLFVMSDIAGTIEQACKRLGRPAMEIQFFLNDLPANDFNALFYSIHAEKEGENTNFSSCFVAAVAGSFYERLFPKRSIHFFHSTSSLHWLSQDPLRTGLRDRFHINKGGIYISKQSPSYVRDAYLTQFKQDFANFLKLRSIEMAIGSRMVLTFIGRWGYQAPSDEFYAQVVHQLSKALMDMVKEGHIPEEKLDSFNIPFYAPCPDEVANEVITEGSFSWDCLKVFNVDVNSEEEGTGLNFTKGQTIAKTLRAVLEPQLGSHFGSNTVGDLFSRFKNLLDQNTTVNLPKMTYLIVSLVR